jgi:hypothetical protein
VHQNVDAKFSLLLKTFTENGSFSVQLQTSRLLRKLYLDKYIDKWCPQDMLSGFCNVSSNILIELGQALFDESNLVSGRIHSLISLVRGMTFRTKQFYLRNKLFITTEIIKHDKRLHSLDLLASNLMLCLCSPEREIWTSVSISALHMY